MGDVNPVMTGLESSCGDTVLLKLSCDMCCSINPSSRILDSIWGILLCADSKGISESTPLTGFETIRLS
jgi:hypothetical protein